MNVVTKTGIYFIRNHIDDRIYIGKSIDIFHRFRKHKESLTSKKRTNCHLQAFVNKYGIDNLIFEPLIFCLKDQLNFFEKRYIKLFDTKRKGFNQTNGGDGGGYDKPYCLKNMVTGEIEMGDQIKEFATRHGFSENGVSEVVKGNRKYIFDWYNPKKWNPKEYELIDPNGKKHKIIETKIKQFSTKYNLNVDLVCLVLNKKRESTQGWKRSDSILNRENLLQAKSFKVISPNGKIIEGFNRSQFCRENGLWQSNFNAMLLGKKKFCQGWRAI